ncbi:hypothetical protein KEM55_002871 [Ascosphaera atra]|nr:hypothetical protein KEM55_002871 [Ascosphaera atra]
MAGIRHRVTLATSVASHFDALSSDSAIAADAPTVALLARIRAEITYFVDHDFTTTPLPALASPPVPPRAPVSPATTYASAASQSPAPAPVLRPSSPAASQWQTVARRVRSLPSTQPADPRLMVRLPRDSAFRSRTAAQCLLVARRALGSFSAALKSVQCVPSGLALVPVDRPSRAQLLSAAPALRSAFNATALDEQTGRDSFFVPFAPRTFPSFVNGQTVQNSLTEQAYMEELAAVLGVAPHTVTWLTTIPVTRAPSLRPSQRVASLPAAFLWPLELVFVCLSRPVRVIVAYSSAPAASASIQAVAAPALLSAASVVRLPIQSTPTLLAPTVLLTTSPPALTVVQKVNDYVAALAARSHPPSATPDPDVMDTSLDPEPAVAAAPPPTLFNHPEITQPVSLTEEEY